MWKAVLAGTAAAVISSSSLVFADQMCDRDGASRWQPSAADIKAFTDARVAALKAGLELTAEQEKNWPAVEAAIRDMAKARADRVIARANAPTIRSGRGSTPARRKTWYGGNRLEETR